MILRSFVVALVVAILVGLTQSTPALADAPPGKCPSGQVCILPFYDGVAGIEFVNGWLDGWMGSGKSWNGIYVGDGPWNLWEKYGGPQYQLYDSSGKNLIQKGYFPKNLQLPLKPGEYRMMLLPPEGPSPNGTPWHVTSPPVRIFVRENGKIEVYWITNSKSTDWKPTGDIVLVGIVNDPLSCGPKLESIGWVHDSGDYQFIGLKGSCFTPNSLYQMYLSWRGGSWSSSWIGSTNSAGQTSVNVGTIPGHDVRWGFRERDLSSGRDSNPVTVIWPDALPGID